MKVFRLLYCFNIFIFFIIFSISLADINLIYSPSIDKIDENQIKELLKKNFPSHPLNNYIIKFIIDNNRSEISFKGSTPLYNFDGKTKKISGLMEADYRNLLDTGKAVVTIDAVSFKSGIKARDENMITVLDVNRYPDIIFTMSNLFVLDYDLNKLNGDMIMSGDLNFHGVNRGVKININGYIKDEMLYVNGETSIIPTDFGIEIPTPPIIIFFNKMRDKIMINFDVVWVLWVDDKA